MTELASSVPTTRPVWRSILWSVVAVTLLLGGAWGYTRWKSPVAFYGTAYDPNTPAPALTGTGEDGRPFDLNTLRGQTVAVFFGALPADQRERFRSVLVTLDPARDDVKRLREYVRFFSPSAQGVFVPEPALYSVAAAWGVGFQKSDVKSATDYQINHTTGVYLIDAAGQRRVVWDYTQLTDVERVARDVQAVMP
jgi:protein SCO1/2